MLRYKDILLCYVCHLMMQYELLGSCYEVNNISRPSPSATFVSVEQFGIVGCSSQYLALWWAGFLLLHPPTSLLILFPFPSLGNHSESYYGNPCEIYRTEANGCLPGVRVTLTHVFWAGGAESPLYHFVLLLICYRKLRNDGHKIHWIHQVNISSAWWK